MQAKVSFTASEETKKCEFINNEIFTFDGMELIALVGRLWVRSLLRS